MSASLPALLPQLKRFEAQFSPQALSLLQETQRLVGKVEEESHSPSCSTSSLAAYVTQGFRHGRSQEAHQQLLAAFSKFTTSTPLPRSLKDDVNRALLELSTQQSAYTLVAEQTSVALKLRKLCSSLEHSADMDEVERQVDGLIKSLLLKLHGTETLDPEALQGEQEALVEAVASATTAKQAQDAQSLRLVQNTLQRIHASQLASDDESEQTDLGANGVGEEEDDDDDPFFMPMPGAIVWADASKFNELARPLAPERSGNDVQFMIRMEGDEAADVLQAQQAAAVEEEHASGATADACQEATLGSTSGAGVTHLQALNLSSAASGEAVMQDTADTPNQAEVPAPALSPPLSPDGLPSEPSEVALAAPEAQASVDAASKPADTEPPPEKIKQFVNFLDGQHQGACMFHEQMRLSVEGCVKLATFLKSSARVKALSLSHNHLGDDRLQILCEGMQANSSLTALDLPDNDITDHGAEILARAICHNQNLTQLQLSYNRISDKGAAALAQVVRSNHGLRKLGLSNNCIGKAGCQALTAAITSNSNLKQLQILPGNPVEEKDAKALAKALKRNNKFSIKEFLGIN